jgi:TP901 family phage tail tape measure protein
MASSALIWDLIARDKASPAFLRVASSADKAAASTAKATAGLSASVARMGAVGATLTKKVTLPLLALGAVSVAQAAKYQKSLNTIQVATGRTNAEMQAGSKGLLAIAKSTGTGLDHLTDSFYVASKSGLSVAKSLAVTKAAAQAAKAENADLGTVTQALTSVMASYGKTLHDPVAAMNEIIKGSGLAKTTTQDFAASLSNVVPIASSLGISFDQVAGAIATMTQHGETAQRATENLSNLITNLAGQNNVASQALQQLGVNTISLSKNLGKRGLVGSLNDVLAAVAKNSKGGLVVTSAFKRAGTATASLRTELAHMPKALKANAEAFDTGKMSYKNFYAYAKSLGGQQFQLAKELPRHRGPAKGFNNQLKSGNSTTRTVASTLQKALGGVTGMRVALMLSGQSAEQFARSTKAVKKAATETKGDVLGWAKTQNTLAVKMDKAKASLQVMAVEIGTALIPAVTKMAALGSKAAHWFDGLDSGKKKILGIAAVALAVLGPIMSIGARLTLLGTSLATFGNKWGTRMASMAGASEQAAARVGVITRNMVRGVSGILAGGVAAQIGGNSKGGWLASIMLGTAGGWALSGGPVGAAVGGVSAAIFKGVGLWTAHKKAAQQAAAAEKAVVDNLTAAIEQDNGALGTNLRLMITRTLQGKGVLDQAQKLGLNLADVVASAMGNKGAAGRISATLRNLMAQTESSLEDFERKHGIRTAGAIKNALAGKRFDVNQVGDQRGHLSGADLARFRQLAAQEGLIVKFKNNMGTAGAEIDKAKAKADQFAHALNDGRVATGKYGTQLAALGKHTSIAVDANGQLTRSLNGNTVAGEHNRKTLFDLANAAQVDADKALEDARQHHSFADAVKIASGRLSGHISQLEAAAQKAGFNKKQVADLVEMYRHIPASVLTQVKKTGTLPSDIQAIIDKMRQLDGMRAAIYVSTVSGTKTKDPRLKASGGEISGPGSGHVGLDPGDAVERRVRRPSEADAGTPPRSSARSTTAVRGSRPAGTSRSRTSRPCRRWCRRRSGTSGPRRFREVLRRRTSASAVSRADQARHRRAEPAGPEGAVEARRRGVPRRDPRLHREANRQLGHLRVKIKGSDLAAIKRGLRGTVDDTRAAFTQLFADARAAGRVAEVAGPHPGDRVGVAEEPEHAERREGRTGPT